MKELEKNSLESSELVEQTFNFWLTDNEHIRSPFPSYIHSSLKPQATERFYSWVNGLKPEAKDELNDEAVGEKFEEIIFEIATNLIKTEDERITILYPFLPRIGDDIKDEKGIESTIYDRKLSKQEDLNFLDVTCERNSSKEKWSTSFQLPI